MKLIPRRANSSAAARDLLCQLLFVFLATNLGAVERAPRAIPDGDSLRHRFSALIDRARVPLNPIERSAVIDDGVLEVKFEFDSEADERVPGLLVKSATSPPGPLPVVIVLHGTGGNKEAMKGLLQVLARRGVLGVAFDARYAGERAKHGKGSEDYRAAILETWKSGERFPFYYDTVWDLQRLLDYLETRSDVDPKRIGGIGFSKGGTELYLAAAVDQRIVASVPCIGVQSFDWALKNNAWQSRVGTIQSAVDGAARELQQGTVDAAFVRRFYQRVVPGIESDFDGPQMLPLIAPRPLLVINGDRDDRTPGPGVKLCVDAAREAYGQQEASQNFEFRSQPNVGHAVTPESQQYAVDWLIRQLRSK